MSAPLPLAEAAQRLRGKPGRPKLTDAERAARQEKRRAAAAARVASVSPRLLDVHGAARYLNVSAWSIRDMITAGTIARVRLDAVRRLLVDRADLDKLIESSKEGPAA